jgi:hypothetical protein
MSTVNEMAREILDIQDELHDLRREVARLRKIEAEFNQYLGESLAHGEKMMVGWLDLILSGNLNLPEEKAKGGEPTTS